MAMRTKMNSGGGIALVYNRSGAKETLREIMLEIAAKQEKELKKQEHLLAIAQEELVRSEESLLKSQKKLENAEKKLENAQNGLKKEQKELENEQKELSEIKEKTESLKKQHIEFEKRHIEFEKEKKLMVSFSKKQDKFAAHIDEINKLVEQFTQQVLKRGELTSTLVAKIKACKGSPELKGEKFVQQFDAIQASFDDVTKEVDMEDAILDQVQEAFHAYEGVLDEMKAELDELAHTSKPLYDKHISSYESACRWLSNLKAKFDNPLAYKSTNDETGKNCARILDELEERLEQEKLAAEKKDSPSSSKSHTPPSDSDILGASNSDDDASLASNLSGASLSRKSSASSDSDKLKKDSPASSPASPTPKLSSSAMVSSMLPLDLSASLRLAPKPELGSPQIPVVPSQSAIPSNPLLSSKELKQQPHAVSKASFASPEKEKSYLVTLGFNKDKSVSQQSIPVAGSANVTPVAIQQRNGLNSVR